MYFDDKESIYLIPTAEVPVTNFHRNEIIDESELPLKNVRTLPVFVVKLAVGERMSEDSIACTSLIKLN